jgi:hypothetical protein
MSLLRVRRLTPDDWQAYKHIRLRALATDAAAFSSTFAREENMADDEWRTRLARSAVFIGQVDGAEVGLVGRHSFGRGYRARFHVGGAWRSWQRDRCSTD